MDIEQSFILHIILATIRYCFTLYWDLKNLKSSHAKFLNYQLQTTIFNFQFLLGIVYHCSFLNVNSPRRSNTKSSTA